MPTKNFTINEPLVKTVESQITFIQPLIQPDEQNIPNGAIPTVFNVEKDLEKFKIHVLLCKLSKNPQ